MASIDEVARLAGVSTATVSRALSGRGHVSESAKERVQAAAQSLGYVVSSRASSLASGRTRNVGVIVPFLDRWFFSTVLSGVSAALMREGYDITLYNITADKDVRRHVFDTFLRRQRVDAVIAVSIELDEDETQYLLDLGLPVIAIGGPNPKLDTLTVDDVAVAQLATEHLISLGHTDIAHIGANPEFDIDFHIPTNRRLGFEKALAKAGIPSTMPSSSPPTSRSRAATGRRSSCSAARAPARPPCSRPRTRWPSAHFSRPETWASAFPRSCRSSASTGMNSASSSA